MKSKYWLYLFFADVLADLVAIAANCPAVRMFSKPLLMLFLFAWVMTASSKFLPLRYYLLAALFFSWLGDCSLLHAGTGWFMAGLASFLLAHLAYLLFFLRVRKASLVRPPLRFFAIVVVAAYTASLYIFLYPRTGRLQLPVAVYALVISSMLIAAVHAFPFTKRLPAKYCISGAALFVLSDSLLAINKFYRSFPLADLAIMLSYCAAQFALSKGSLLYLAGINKSGEPAQV